MRRRVTTALAAVLVVLVGLLGLVAPSGAQEVPSPDTTDTTAPSPTDTVAPIPPPAASIVVDADTGEVITASNDRQALPPASTTKILTALLVRDHLDFAGTIGISGTAALAPPRRLALQAGEQWGVEDLTYAMLHCSCNDAAWALGQAAGGGTMPGFAAQAQILADELGLEDDPVLRDPAGLDDERSVEGGNLLSARDLAIAARAFLADPELAQIATDRSHEWVGGDGEPHSVTNLNRFLDAYPGSIGVKTGSTSRAGLTFVAAAERDGRTLIAVVLDSDNHYAHARELLDAGFLLAAIDETTGDVLPPVPTTLASGGVPETTTTTSTTTTTEATTAPPASSAPTTEVADAAAAAAPAADTSGGSGRRPADPGRGGRGPRPRPGGGHRRGGPPSLDAPRRRSRPARTRRRDATDGPAGHRPRAPEGASPRVAVVDPELDLDAVAADLAGVEAALERLDEGSYGRCLACDAPIDDIALAAAPTRTTCDAHLPV